MDDPEGECPCEVIEFCLPFLSASTPPERGELGEPKPWRVGELGNERPVWSHAYPSWLCPFSPFRPLVPFSTPSPREGGEESRAGRDELSAEMG